MVSLRQRSRKIWIALAVALSLTVLSAVGTPLFGDELANWLSGPATVLAEETSDGGG
jgi:hypothetical protein